MTKYQMATIFEAEDDETATGIVLDEFSILRVLEKHLSEQKKHELLGLYLSTRTDRYLVMFCDGRVALFRPDDLEISTHYEEVA